MISVSALRSEERLTLTVEGHAGYGKEGQDIVCAAASALCFALLLALKRLDSEGLLSSFDHRLERGFAFFSAAVTPAGVPIWGYAVDPILNAFALLGESYPGYVSFE